MLSVVILSVVILSVIMLSVIMLSVVMLSVMAPWQGQREKSFLKLTPGLSQPAGRKGEEEVTEIVQRN
jgi:hypothetical protein